MKRLGYFAVAAAVAVLALPPVASATPAVDGFFILPTVFDDCLLSTLTYNLDWPGAAIDIQNDGNGCVGFADLSVWQFSDDAGATGALFTNDSCFRFGATMVISGTSEAEAGINISPWWFDGDGRINVRTTDGEIAVFGGRLPFYSFTGNHALSYVKGTPITLEMIYNPNGLTSANPGTIQYVVTYNSIQYASPVFPFDEGNPGEDPPYGLWGILNDAQVGGFFQVLWQQGAGDPDGSARVEYRDIFFEACGPIPVEPATWGSIKKQF